MAQSSRAFWSVDGGGSLPWSSEAVDLVDELCEERLPQHLLDPGREQRETDREHRAQLRENRAWFATQHESLAERTREERAQLLAEAKERSGPYSSDLWRLEDAIQRLDTTDPEAAAAGRDDANGER